MLPVVVEEGRTSKELKLEKEKKEKKKKEGGNKENKESNNKSERQSFGTQLHIE